MNSPTSPGREGHAALETTALVAAILITTIGFEGLHRAASAGPPERRIERAVPLAADGRVVVENLAGTVTVIGWDRPEVHVAGELGRGVDRLEVSSSGGETVVRVVIPDGLQKVEPTQLELRVPVACAIEIRTVSADVALAGVSGAIDVNTTSGDIRLAADAKELVAETVSGDVLVAGNVPRLMVRTVSGDLGIEGRVSEAKVDTVSGDITFAGAELRAGSVHTVSGTVRYDGRLVSGGEIGLQTQSGDIELSLPKNDPVDLDIETRSGEIVDLLAGDGTIRAPRFGMGGTARKARGASGTRVRVSTLSGDVHVRPRV